MTLRRLVLIADDYAISPAVSLGIRELAALGRLTGTGVMATMPHWPDEAAALRELHGKVEIGLHITLTDQAPLGPMTRLAPAGKLPSVGRLLAASLARRIPLAEIAGEIERQLDRFEKYFGAMPDFIDGHQHVHVLPGVWPLVRSLFGRRLDPARCWLRDVHDPACWRRGMAGKATLISVLGRPASRRSDVASLRGNRGFSGFYDYEAGGLSDFFAPMMRFAGDGHAMMVHPGHVDEALRRTDSLTDPREEEWRFLSGPDFPTQLAGLGFCLAEPGFLIDATSN